MKRALPTWLAAALATGAVAYLGWSLWRVYGNRVIDSRSIVDSSGRHLPAPVIAPRPISADRATTLRDDDLVVGVVGRDGEARAYSIRYLASHEHVNDALGRTPLCVTW